MKKFLILMLGLAVASSAIAGPVKQVQATSKQPAQIVKTNAQMKAQPAQLNAPVLQKKQFGLPIEVPQVKFDPATAIPSLKAPVTTQPDGEVKYYMRSAGKAIYHDNEGIYYSDPSGYVVVVENGNTIWFKNLLYDPGHLYDDYWIKGTKSGNTITINLTQDIRVGSLIYSGAEDFTIVLGWGSCTMGSEDITFRRSSTSSAKFTIDGDKLTLNNASNPNSTTSGTGNGLCAYFGVSSGWSTTYYFEYMASLVTELTYIGTEIPETPEMVDEAYLDELLTNGNAVEKKYNRYGMSLILDQDEEGYFYNIVDQAGTAYVIYDNNGTDVYMYQPVYGWRYRGNWAKGRVEGDQLIFPVNQYIYWDDVFQGGYVTYGVYVNAAAADGGGFHAIPEVTEYSYTVSDGVISLNDAGYVPADTVEGTPMQLYGIAVMVDSVYQDAWFSGNLDFFTEYYDIPTTPESLTVEPGSTTAAAAWVDTDDSEEISWWNLRYRKVLPGTENNREWGFEEDNNDNENTDLPAGWTCIDADGDGNEWYHLTGSTFKNHDGIGHVTSASYNGSALDPDNWLVSPAVQLDGTLSFWAVAQDPSYSAENFAVYVNVGGDPTNTADFVAISDKLTAPTEVTKYEYDLTEYAGAVGYVAIRHYDTHDMFRLNIDDVSIFVAEPAEWQYVEGIEGFAATMEGLTPETLYEAQVQAANNGGYSAWTESVQFVTLAQVGLLGDVNDDGQVNITDVTALISAVLNDDFGSINGDNADLTGEGDINISDITALISLVLNS